MKRTAVPGESYTFSYDQRERNGYRRKITLALAASLLVGIASPAVAVDQPHPKDGIGDWRESDIVFFLKTGFFPDGDIAGEAMAEVIDDGTSHLNDADRAAIATYLRDSPPLPGP